jgi:glutamate N-acetyltransferase/amino-acid N-acetyltransferase
MSDHDLQVPGFSFASCAAGIKKAGKLDLTLIHSETPAVCAGVFTTNKVVAAPVLLGKPRIESGRCQAILINSGNANACTGKQGMTDARRCAELTATALGIDDELVVVSSTGVIGVPLPMACFEESVPQLPANLSTDGAAQSAEAMMTTDSFAKTGVHTGKIGDHEYRIVGIAKGAGMIHPNMATMLGFVMTDINIAAATLQSLLKKSVDQTFNCISVDGDTSTNDTVIALANGQAGNEEFSLDSAEAQQFGELLEDLLLELAKMIVRDGEGATKLARINVSGAASTEDARMIARTVATSSLVKTAFFGQDANWGRIIAAAGYSGADVDPNQIDILFNDIPVVRHGLSTGPELEAQATEVLQTPEFDVNIELSLGDGQAVYYTSDLTYDYIKINADYRT